MIYGITGRIGSGKSHVCKLMHNQYGANIFDCDEQAKGILNYPEIKKKVCLMIGKECYDVHGKYNPEQVIKLLMNNKFKIRLLTHIVQDELLKLFKRGCSHMRNNMGKDTILVIESAILFDLGWDKHVDKMIWVDADFDVRRQRVMDRHGTGMYIATKYMMMFPQGNTHKLKADYVIENNGIRPIDLRFVE